jgi:hypothetical protein
MTVRNALFAFLAAAALPLQANANSCVFTAQGADGKGQTTCTYVEDEGVCAQVAAQNGTPEWVKAHPPRFVTGKNCNAAVKAVKSGKAGDAKGAPKKDKVAAPAAAPGPTGPTGAK